MDASSVRNLCRHVILIAFDFHPNSSFTVTILITSVQTLFQLISSAIQRCRISGELCRLSVGLKSFPLANPPLVRISSTSLSLILCILV